MMTDTTGVAELLHNFVSLPSAGVLQHQHWQHSFKTMAAHLDGISIPEISTGNFILVLVGQKALLTECTEKGPLSVTLAALQPRQLLKQRESGHHSD